jgi:hypothetical protein
MTSCCCSWVSLDGRRCAVWSAWLKSGQDQLKQGPRSDMPTVGFWRLWHLMTSRKCRYFKFEVLCQAVHDHPNSFPRLNDNNFVLGIIKMYFSSLNKSSSSLASRSTHQVSYPFLLLLFPLFLLIMLFACWPFNLLSLSNSATTTLWELLLGWVGSPVRGK